MFGGKVHMIQFKVINIYYFTNYKVQSKSMIQYRIVHILRKLVQE